MKKLKKEEKKIKLKKIRMDGNVMVGIESVEEELRFYLERSDIEVIRWQIVPIFSAFHRSPHDLNFSYESGVDLFIEYKNK